MLQGYEKIKTVGKGSFGTATLYRRTEDNKHVVLKEIFTMDMDNNEKQASLNEVEIIATLIHPNIVRYLGSFQQPESIVIIMEFADGGNLAQLISLKKNNNDTFREDGILNIISQISSAIGYMHSKKILHRDLKCANVFLTIDGVIKVGDFGISKKLNTKLQAETVIGTPYYLSPEMCDGSSYNEKSDVWAIGCILYELAALRKPFEAPTLPSLVKKITKCEYDDIPMMYSNGLQNLVNLILQRSIDARPSALDINKNIIPELSEKFKLTLDDNSTTTSLISKSVSADRSIIYEITEFEDPKIKPIEMPQMKVIEIALSNSHGVLVSSDNLVFAWGSNDFGQLGISNRNGHVKAPVQVVYLRDKHIVKVAAGNGFSIFLSTYGYVFSCGEGTNGSLGIGESKGCLTPTLINSLATTNIIQISCGYQHVVALSNLGKVYTWGTSKKGALGQGHKEKRFCLVPTTIMLAKKIKDVYSSNETTFLTTFGGEILVAGDNNFGQLGLSNRSNIVTFSIVNGIYGKVQISSGKTHTVLLNNNQDLVGFGRNTEYQLEKSKRDYLYSSFNPLNKKIKMISSGDYFTAAVDKENVLWVWGSYKTDTKEDLTTEYSGSQIQKSIKNPRSVLALYSSGKNLKQGNCCWIGDIKAKECSILVLVHTTTPTTVKTYDEFNSETNNFVSESSRFSQLKTNLPNTPRWD